MKYILIIILFFAQSTLKAQRFSASVLAGINMSQIDGDNLAGYNKLGINAGLGVDARINEQFGLGMELLFSQKGSRSKVSQMPPGQSVKLSVNYAEIPVLFRYHDKNGAIFGLGFSYSALVGFSQWENGSQVIAVDSLLGNNDIQGLAEFTFSIKKHWGANARIAYSLLPIAHWSSSRFRKNAVYNNNISIRLVYYF